MACGGDKVQKSVYSVVPEARITLDTRLFCQDVIVLTLKMSNDFLKAVHTANESYSYDNKEH